MGRSQVETERQTALCILFDARTLSCRFLHAASAHKRSLDEDRECQRVYCEGTSRERAGGAKFALRNASVGTPSTLTHSQSRGVISGKEHSSPAPWEGIAIHETRASDETRVTP